MKKILVALMLFFVLLGTASAQEPSLAEEPSQIQPTETDQTDQELSEQSDLSLEIESLLVLDDPQVSKIRNLDSLSLFNFIPYTLFAIIDQGLPAETLVLILMIPILTTLLVFMRNIVGLPALDMLVIIAFSIALLATDLIIGVLLLGTILFSSMTARMLFNKVKIMQLPKISLSMMVVSFAVLIMLSILAFSGLVSVESVSIVPILLLIILSERIVRLEFERKPRQVWMVVFSSLSIGVVGYYLLLSETARMIVLNFPELVILLIPINLFMGRYFGLRLTEYYRFQELLEKPKVIKKKK